MRHNTIRRILRAVCLELIFVILISTAGLFLFKVVRERKTAEKKDQKEIEEEKEKSGGRAKDKVEDASILSGSISGFSEEGNLITDISASSLNVFGIDQNDIVLLTIGEREYILPVEIDEPLMRIWGRTHLALSETDDCMCVIRDYQDFAMMEGYSDRNIGDAIGITLLQSDGYQMQMLEPLGLTDAVANFRVVETGDIGKGMIYRGHSPIDPKYSDIRCRCADDLAWENEIASVLNLNQEDYEVEKDVYNKCPESFYRYLYDQGSICTTKLDGKSSYSDEFREGIGKQLRFMLEHKGPYMVHCRMGKDRAGFVVALLQALEEANYDEIAEEYAKSFRNYYGVQKGSWMDEYNKTDGANTFLEMMLPQRAAELKDDDGTGISLAARNYMEQTGLSDNEIDSLKEKLSLDCEE